ncbi:ABC transporter permease [Mycoplasmopsis verecunda]|uniref:Oligopeptide transport system permease protein n=1 Tax=Mycoplasmopsis verecunda TaxID=171291 RepID=A0A1T4LNH5_9BACT|nr:ABC transporter permease [Mycoplasmopsis verecunda]WPB54717.1 ABC transporter permease [Mycoplasmopsis verecunda]SJZ56282.1 oligopeptide transport system permease protein [Mycoplasmopsis verecunda]
MQKVNYRNQELYVNDAKVIFKNKRSEDLSWFWRLLSIDSPFLKSFFRIAKILIEFFIIGLIVVSITFFLINSVPGGNPLTNGLDEASRKAVEAKYGLDLPLVKRYFNYLGGLFTGNFGISLSLFPGQDINSFIWVRFYKSFLVGIFSVFLTVGIGIPLGIWIGKNPGGWVDNISTIVVSIFSSVPSIIFALVLVFLGREAKIPYVFDHTQLITYILPGLALSLGSIIVYIKYIRTELNRELNSVHAKFAYLKGVSKNRFVWKHALKPALFPIATFFPAVIFGSFIGSIFIEQIFLIPGSGDTLLQAIQTKDYNVILFLIIMFAFLTVLSYAFRDILYEAIDPRVRRRGA